MRYANGLRLREGRGELKGENNMELRVEENGEQWIRMLCREYTSQGWPDIVKLLQYAQLERLTYGEHDYREDTLILWVREQEWESMPGLSACFVKIDLGGLATSLKIRESRVMVYPPDKEPYYPIVYIDEDESDEVIGLNNCFFEPETTIEHDALRFRSQAEVSIYEELKKRKLLFFPNAAAVLGEEGKKREPDFLICDKGKWGILEVMGKDYHKDPVKDHERARLFKKQGLMCIEFYSGGRCLSNPSAVVDDFLALIAGY
jgi:hypothetical protein